MLVSHYISLLLSIISFVTGMKLPVEGTLVKSVKKEWERVTCKKSAECPRMIKRQREGYSEVCFLGNRDWYKLIWMRETQQEEEDKDESSHAREMSAARHIAMKFITETRYYQEVYRLNRDYTIFRSKIQSFLTRIFHINSNKVQIELYLLKPKFEKGSFQVPCNKELFVFLNVDSCEDMQDKFRMTSKAPKCYYVTEPNQTKEKLDEIKQELGVSHENEVLVGVFSEKFNDKMTWFETYKDLCDGDCIEKE